MLTKFFKIVSYGLSLILFVLTIIVVVNVITAKTKGVPPNIFGYSFHIIVSQSMQGEIDPGDFVIAKRIETKDVVIGDNIVFKSIDPLSYGKIIIHKVVAVEEVGGQIAFTTKGVKAGLQDDEYKVTEVLGKSYYVSSALAPLLLDATARYKVILIFGFLVLGIIIAIATLSIIKNIKNQRKEVERNK